MSKGQQHFIIQVVKFVCVQVIKQHCVFCKFVKKAINSQLVVVVIAICKKIKSTPRFETIRKRKMNKSSMIQQVNLAVDAWIKNVVEFNLQFYQELWADFFVDNPSIWFTSKVKLVEIWTSNKSNIVETNIKLLLLPAVQKKKKKKIIKKILNHRHHNRSRIIKIVSNNNNNHNQRNLVNPNKNRNHNNQKKAHLHLLH